MKLHQFHANVGDDNFRAFTRDKAGKALNKQLSLEKGEGDKKKLAQFKRSDWKYKGAMNIDFGSHAEDIQILKRDIKEIGVSFATITPFAHTIYVFDVPFDREDVRVYSLDENLERFSTLQEGFELSPKGMFMGHGEPKLVGTISGKYFDELQSIGIDMSHLVEVGFSLKQVMPVDEMEAARRFMERQLRQDLPKKVESLGIEIDEIRVLAVEPARSSPAKDNSNEMAKDDEERKHHINIENNPNININMNNSNTQDNKSEKRGFFWTMCTIIGLIAGIITIWVTVFDGVKP